MQRSCFATLGLIWAGVAAGCAEQALPTLPSAPGPPASGPAETATANTKPSGPAVETTVTVPGTPTEVYALVARGALNCWFGGNGPLRTTHLFHADAAPPSKGGSAQIVLHERDASLSDQRGTRAVRVSFASEGGQVQVNTVVSRIPAAMAELMVRDVEVWARGGSGCQLRSLASPPQPAQAPAPAKKGGAANSSR